MALNFFALYGQRFIVDMSTLCVCTSQTTGAEAVTRIIFQQAYISVRFLNDHKFYEEV